MIEPAPLVISKEEQLVLDDGTTQRAAKHIPAKLGRADGSGGIEPVFPLVGVQGVVAEKFKHIAVEGIGSRFQRGVDDSPIEVSVLGGSILGDEIEFLNGIGRRRQAEAILRRLIVVDAIEQEV